MDDAPKNFDTIREQVVELSIMSSAQIMDMIQVIDDALKNINALFPLGQKGIIQLKADLPTLIVPDIHTRREELSNLLLSRDDEGKCFLELFVCGHFQILLSEMFKTPFFVLVGVCPTI